MNWFIVFPFFLKYLANAEYMINSRPRRRYILIYIYICVCVERERERERVSVFFEDIGSKILYNCMCVYIYRERERERESVFFEDIYRERERKRERERECVCVCVFFEDTGSTILYNCVCVCERERVLWINNIWHKKKYFSCIWLTYVLSHKRLEACIMKQRKCQSLQPATDVNLCLEISKCKHHTVSFEICSRG